MAAILSAIDCRTKPVFELEREVNGSNPYMKFGRIRLKVTELEWLRTDGQTDRQTDRQTDDNPYMKFGRIRLKITELEWLRTDRQTDGQAENNRAPPTFVGGALIKEKFRPYYGWNVSYIIIHFYERNGVCSDLHFFWLECSLQALVLMYMYLMSFGCLISVCTVLPAKSDSDFMFCLQSYQGLIIDRSLVY